jgi:hypothetical protein
LHLGIYHCDGDADALLAAYGRLAQAMPPNGSAVHVCVRRAGGITT